MKRFCKQIVDFLYDEDGVSAIEYALIASLIAMGILGSIKLLGGNLAASYNNTAGALMNVMS